MKKKIFTVFFYTVNEEKTALSKEKDFVCFEIPENYFVIEIEKKFSTLTEARKNFDDKVFGVLIVLDSDQVFVSKSTGKFEQRYSSRERCHTEKSTKKNLEKALLNLKLGFSNFLEKKELIEIYKLRSKRN
jgi:hypothetical protein